MGPQKHITLKRTNILKQPDNFDFLETRTVLSMFKGRKDERWKKTHIHTHTYIYIYIYIYIYVCIGIDIYP